MHLCRRHHRHVLEGGARVCIDANQQVIFFAPDGAALAPTPRHRGNVGSPPTGPATRQIRPAGRDGAAKRKRDSRIPWTIDALALEGLEAADDAR